MCQSLRKYWKTCYAFDVQHYSCIFFVHVGTILYVSLTVFSFGLSLITFFFFQVLENRSQLEHGMHLQELFLQEEV